MTSTPGCPSARPSPPQAVSAAATKHLPLCCSYYWPGLRRVATPFGFAKWMTESAMNRLTSSMPGMVFTPRRLSVFCNRLSSVEVVLCTAFFFLQGTRAGLKVYVVLAAASMST